MRFILVVLALFLISNSKSQTCIIGRLEKKKITVIADSKITLMAFGNYNAFDLKLSPILSSMKKIGGSKNIFFAVSGIDVENSFEVAQELSNNSISFDSTITKFIENRSNKLKQIAQRVIEIDYWKYENELKYHEAMQFLFFGFVKRKPRMVEIKLDIVQYIDVNNFDLSKSLRTPSISLKKNVYTNKSKGFEAIAIAYFEDIKDSLNIKETWKGKSEIVGERLMRKQINGRPEIVGAPIDILILRKNKKPIWKRID